METDTLRWQKSSTLPDLFNLVMRKGDCVFCLVYSKSFLFKVATVE